MAASKMTINEPITAPIIIPVSSSSSSSSSPPVLVTGETINYLCCHSVNMLL